MNEVSTVEPKFYFCPVLNCPIREVRLTLNQLLQHLLYHAAKELFENELKTEECERENLQPELLRAYAKNKLEGIELSDLTHAQV